MSKWGKKSLLIVLSLVTALVFAGCAKEKSDEEKMQELVEEAFKDSGIKVDASSTSDEKPTVESTLFDINNFVIGDIWNDGFVNIGDYAGSGTNALGETMDIDFTIEQLGKAMEKKAEYDTYIQGLESNYDDVKQVWTKLSSEIDTLYNKLKENPPKADDNDYEFDTGLFQQYSDAFSADVDALNQN
ncbi:hypothetical protein [Paenibacillus sp. NEAU-GSW1]|uniref:hypothetical protein n=1 Tax=Paenibacillus sp. NEAU-GSW1 TaxID=2682486 RepID=UPI0012E25345|nr:hypothetical protein [Paenibacillus sp. NEAU-GSW1]MUT65703.1 hypothetical protein [Paenibacillus sp. NEAU-GSW1]